MKSSTKTVLLVVAIGSISFSMAATGTFALFSDSEDASGTIQITVSNNNNHPGPPNGKAYNDADGDGKYDKNEETYNLNKKKHPLRNFDEPDVNLVIPENVGDISYGGNGDLSVKARSIVSSANFNQQNFEGSIQLTSTEGTISLSGQTINSDTDNVIIESAGDLDLEDATVSANNGKIIIISGGVLNIDNADISSGGKIEIVAQEITGQFATIQNGGEIEMSADGDLNIDQADITGDGDIEVSAQEVSAKSVLIDPGNGGTNVSATKTGGGTLDVTGADISGSNAGITLESVGSMWMNESTLTSQNGDATANLGTSTATLYMNNSNIEDKDQTLQYNPDDIKTVGN